jgi:hypothetical protein
VSILVNRPCASVAGLWSLHATGTGDLTGQAADVALNLFQDPQGNISGTFAIQNPIQACAASPSTVLGKYNSDGTFAFTAISDACHLQGELSGSLTATACSAGHGIGHGLESPADTFNWTMIRK